MPAQSPTIRMRFGRTDRITIRGVAHRYLRETGDGLGHVLERCDEPGLCRTLTHEEFWQERGEPGFAYDKNAFPDDDPAASAEARVASMASVPRDEHAEIVWKLRICERFRDLVAEGDARRALGRKRPDPAEPADEVMRVSRSDAGIRIAYAIMARRDEEASARRNAEAKEAGEPVPRGPRNGVAVRKLPDPKTLRYYLSRLDEADWDPAVLRLRYDLCGSDDLRIPVETEVFMAAFVRRYASANRPTQKQCHRELVAAIEDHNSRLPAGTQKMVAPSLDTFCRRIRSLSGFLVYLARWGEKKAKSRFRPVAEGVEAKFPGERVEMDEWSVQLHVLLIWTGAWEALSDEEREKVERGRVWVCIAICCATRICLGLALTRNPSTEAVLAVLRMIVSDKTAYAEAVGARSPWTMAVRPTEIVTDGGSTFLSGPSRATIAALRVNKVTTIAGEPAMRGTNERFNRTMHVGFASRFSGRSFENPVARGDYPSEERASVTLDKLAWALARWTVDEYHNTPHAGLWGETPANAWIRLTTKYGVSPVPGRDELRNVFGIDLVRRTGPHGVRLLGLNYQGRALQEHRRRCGDREVELRLDPADIGCVSVKIGDSFFPLACATPDFDGVSMDDWRIALASLRKRFKEQARLTQPIVNQSIREIQALGQRSLDMVGLGSEAPSKEDVERAERDMDHAFRMPERGGPMPDLLAADPSAEDPSDAGAANEDPLDEEPVDDPTAPPAAAASERHSEPAGAGRPKPAKRRRITNLEMKD